VLSPTSREPKLKTRENRGTRNADGERFRIRFLGLVDLIEIHGDDEVYYSMFRTSRPEKHLKPNEQLSVFRPGPKTIRSAWWAVPQWAAGPRRKRTWSSIEERDRAGVKDGARRHARKR
jgi:hypothetical protein